uniref:cysteine dioxygenase n=1 Tax=Setaria viridis TaxID=4556 RepID=A0A4U6UL22_SETVI|nr:hypothetical protein SEVIR_5G214000v2 [Setaria viridis]
MRGPTKRSWGGWGRSVAVYVGIPYPVTYLHFANSPTLLSAVIPLHDHPGMTVFCKILLGSMHIKSYDWVMASSASNQVTKNAKWSVYNNLHKALLIILNTDAIFDATSKIVVLYPEDGETCTVQRVSPCAVLDVMGPPYCLEEGRDCFYFSTSRLASRATCSGSEVAGGDGQYAWLNKVPCTIEMDADRIRAKIRR